MSPWPAPRYNLFCWSFSISLFSIATFASHDTVLLRATGWSSVMEIAGALVQVLSALFAVYVLARYLSGRRKPAPLPHRRALLSATFVVAVLMFVELVLELTIIKPIFGWPSASSVQLRLPWLSRQVGFSNVVGTPSGFVMRQAMLAMLVLSTLNQRYFHPRPNRIVRPGIAGTIIVVLSGIVCVTRVVAGMHATFDVVLGIAFGVYFFWWTTIICRFLHDATDWELKYTERMMIPTIFFAVLPLLFARGSGSHWVVLVLTLFGPLVALYHVTVLRRIVDA